MDNRKVAREQSAYYAKDFTKQEKQAVIINGYAYPNILAETFKLWAYSLSLVSTFSYGITEEGELVILDDEELVGMARELGVGALMTVTAFNEQGVFSNEIIKEVLENPMAQDNLIENIKNNLQLKKMVGVDFDFEYIYEENKEQYVEFIEKATKTLNKEGYIVTVALAPKTSSEQKGLLYQGIDYEGLGAAANYVLVMTYEWGYTFGPPMAVAPLNKVTEVLDYAITQIRPDKILMGIPNYGYDWKLPYEKGKSVAEKISNEEAVLRAQRYGAEILFDEVAQTPYYYYTNEEENQEHVVWFEDERSMRAKFELIDAYDLAGASYWNIMEFFPEAAVVQNQMYDLYRVRLD